MPTTYRELFSQVRENLLECHPSAPSERIIYRHLKQNAQLLFNQALNQPPNWTLAFTQVDVQEGVDEYSLSEASFGKDTLVHTMDDSDPNHFERPVRRMSMQSSLLGGREVYTSVPHSYDLLGEKHSAHTFVFYRETSGGVKVKVLPKPHMACSYKVWYETMEPDVSLGSTITIPMGESLLCVQTAFDSLPGAHWCGFTKQEDADRRKELALTLGNAAKAHQLEYRRYIATDTRRGKIVQSGFLDSDYLADVN